MFISIVFLSMRYVNHANRCSAVSFLLAQDNLFDLELRGKDMHIGHINIRGITSGEKLDQIKIMLHSMEINICMLGWSESKLGGEIPDSFLLI